MTQKEKDRLRKREWYQNHKEESRSKKRDWYARNSKIQSERVRNNRHKNRSWILEMKKELACPCGENHPACLVFHHKDPSQKEESIARAIHNGWGKERILAEIAKCKVMCQNCHTKLHWS